MRGDLPVIGRIVVLAVVSWELAVLFGASEPVYAVLVPVLAVRNDPFASFNVSLARVVGVIVGVLVGVAVVGLLAFGVAAVAAVLVVGLLFGMVLRIGGVLNMQVAISGLLVVALGDPPGYAWGRIWQTCLGALVSVVGAPLLLPPNPAKALRSRLEVLAGDVAGEVRGAASSPVALSATASVAQAHTLADDFARAEHAAEISPLQRRHRDAIAELRGASSWRRPLRR